MRVTVCLFLFVVAQTHAQVRHKDAKVIREQRYNAGDGSFGSAFAQEDGTLFKEESTADGERVGQYSYIDEDGKSITVRYTAGKDGFRIIEGAHVPKGATGLESAAFDPEISASFQEPTQKPFQRQAVRSKARNKQNEQKSIQQNGNFNPFINPADPTHTNLKFNKNAAEYAGEARSQGSRQSLVQSQPREFAKTAPNPRPRQRVQSTFQNFQDRKPQLSSPTLAQQHNSVPACADCEGVNPFVNPADFSHQQQPLAPIQKTQPPFRPQEVQPQNLNSFTQTQEQSRPSFRAPSLPQPTPFNDFTQSQSGQQSQQFRNTQPVQQQQQFQNTRPLQQQQTFQNPQPVQQQQPFQNIRPTQQQQQFQNPQPLPQQQPFQSQQTGQQTQQFQNQRPVQQQQQFQNPQPVQRQQQFNNPQSVQQPQQFSQISQRPQNAFVPSQSSRRFSGEIVPAFLQ